MGVRLWLGHIGFYLIWEQHQFVLHHSWNNWEVKWRMYTHLEYLPEKRNLWSQYFESANLWYTAKSTSNSLLPIVPLENTSSGVYETVSSWHPLSHNIVPWISWFFNQVSSCIWGTMFLEANCDQKLTTLKQSPMTCSSPRRTFFLHALSFQCTSKLCGTFINQFSDYFHIKKMHYTI